MKCCDDQIYQITQFFIAWSINIKIENVSCKAFWIFFPLRKEKLISLSCTTGFDFDDGMNIYTDLKMTKTCRLNTYYIYRL